jgi:hypothetical protein
MTRYLLLETPFLMLLTAAYRLHLVERRLRDTSNRKPISPLYCPESGAYVHHAHDLKRMSASLSFENQKETHEGRRDGPVIQAPTFRPEFSPYAHQVHEDRPHQEQCHC